MGPIGQTGQNATNRNAATVLSIDSSSTPEENMTSKRPIAGQAENISSKCVKLLPLAPHATNATYAIMAKCATRFGRAVFAKKIQWKPTWRNTARGHVATLRTTSLMSHK